MSGIVVLITSTSEEEAGEIARLLVSERKAACVSVVGRVNSLFRWESNIESAAETLLIAKTRADLLSGLMQLVKQHHRYQVPEIIALPIIGGNDDYLRWIDQETSPP